MIEECVASIFTLIKAEGFSGTLIHSYQTSWHHIQEGSNLNKKVTSYKMQEVPHHDNHHPQRVGKGACLVHLLCMLVGNWDLEHDFVSSM